MTKENQGDLVMETGHLPIDDKLATEKLNKCIKCKSYPKDM